NSDKLPGHPPGENLDDQPLVIIGTSANGFIYSDPTFSSSLGYGLELGDVDFLTAWNAASRPRQALAFVTRPRQPTQQAHLSAAEPPAPIARILPTATPQPTPTDKPSPLPATPEPIAAAVAPTSTRVDAPRTQE